MVGLSSAATYAARVKDAIKTSNWEALEHDLERLRQIFLESVVFGNREVATFIGKNVAEARNELLLGARLRPERNAEAMSWMLAGDSATCMAGLRMFRPESNVPTRAAENVEEQALRQLHESRDPISTGDLAEQVECARETASRALTSLRDRGLVRTVPVGRLRLHHITRRGQLFLTRAQAGQAAPPVNLLVTKSPIAKDFLIQTVTVDAPPPPRMPIERIRNDSHHRVEGESEYFNACSDTLSYSTAEKVATREAVAVL